MGERCKSTGDGNRVFLLSLTEALLPQIQSCQFHSRIAALLSADYTWLFTDPAKRCLFANRCVHVCVRALWIVCARISCLCEAFCWYCRFRAAAGRCLLRWTRGVNRRAAETCCCVLRGFNNSVFAVDHKVFSKQGYNSLCGIQDAAALHKHG